jgi:chitinase
VSFAGNASNPEDGTLSGRSLVWTSSRDGQIGTGTSFSTTSLSVGPHTIRLTTTDSQGATGTATVRVIVGYSQRIGTDGGSLGVEACHLSLFAIVGTP